MHREVSNHRSSSCIGKRQRGRPLPPQLPRGETDMRARTIGITRVEDLPDRDHTVWQIKEPATVKQPTWLLLVRVPRNCQTRPHCGSLTTAKLAVMEMLCCGVSLYWGQAVSCNSNWWWCVIGIFEAVERDRYFHWQFCVISDPCV